MILPIVTEPNKVLRAVTAPISEVTDELRTLVKNMRETMKNAEGIGLAAPQIGQSIALCVIELEGDEEDEGVPFMALINPRVTWKSTERTYYTEGCLSIPGIEAAVQRPKKVRVKARDLDFKETTIEADGLFARVLQHEIDHLNGKLFTDYVTKKQILERPLVDYPRV